MTANDAIKTLAAIAIAFVLYLILITGEYMGKVNGMKVLWNYTLTLLIVFLLTIAFAVPLNNCIKGGGDYCNPTNYWNQQFDKHYEY